MQAITAISDLDFDIYNPASAQIDYEGGRLTYGSVVQSPQRDWKILAARLSFAAQHSHQDQKSSSTIEDLEHVRGKRALIELIESEPFQALSFGFESAPALNPDTICFSKKLIDKFKSRHVLPRVAPDGEGDIMMVWNNPPSFLLTIEGNNLHAVVHPATPRSKHIPPVKFDGEAVPSEIAALIPTS